MSKPVFSIHAFLDWAKSKDPTEEYFPSSGLDCALAQYGKHVGIPFPCGGNNYVHSFNDTFNILHRSYEIKGMSGGAIYHRRWRDCDGFGVNNFGNLVEALEHDIVNAPSAI